MAEGAEVLVRFVTHVADIRVPPTAISLPATLDRRGLSSVVNHLLGKGEHPAHVAI